MATKYWQILATDKTLHFAILARLFVILFGEYPDVIAVIALEALVCAA